MNFKKFLAMFLSLAMVLGSMGTVSFAADATDAVAMIGDVYYSSIDEAVNSAADGDTITVLSDCTLSEEITVDKSLTFEGEKVTVGSYDSNGNPGNWLMTIADGVSISGDNLSGAIAIESGATVYVNAPDVAFKAMGDTTFKGDCVAYSFSASNSTINIGADATLKITKAMRLAMGHGNTYNITGNISEAKTTDFESENPSFSTNYGVSLSAGNDSTFNITNAYVLFGYNPESGSYTSASSSNSAKISFNITNSILKTQGKLEFAASKSTGEYSFDCKDSVIKTIGYLKFTEDDSNVVFDNTDVNVDNRQYLENNGNMLIKNGSRVLATVAKSSHGHNAGTLTVDNASYDASGDFTVPDGTTPGKLIVKNGGVANVQTITKNTVEVSEGGSLTSTKITDADVEVSSGGSLTSTTIVDTDIEIDAASAIKSDKIEGTSTVTVDYSNIGAGASISIGNLGSDVEVKSSGEIPDNVDVKYDDNGIPTITVYVAEVDTIKYTDLVSAFKAVKENSVINILNDITIKEDWDRRKSSSVGAIPRYATFTVPVTFNGNNHTIKFTGMIIDANQNDTFRFEAPAEVKNLTIDLSEATANGGSRMRAISAKDNIVVDNCTFIGNPALTNTRAIIVGEGAGTNVGNVTANITNSTFKDWTYGVNDNENAQDVKSIVVTDSTFTNGGVRISAHETVTFTGNTMDDAWVSVTSYTKSDVLKVTASGNTLEENTDTKKNTIYAGAEVDVQEGFTVPGAVAMVGDTYYGSFNKAFAAAGNGDVIDLMGNTVTVAKATVVYGDEKITIKGGTIDLTGLDVTANNFADDAGIYAVPFTALGELVLDDVNVVGDNITSAQGIFVIGTNGKLTLVGGSQINVSDVDATALVYGDGANPALVMAEGTSIIYDGKNNGSDTRGILSTDVAVNSAAIEMKNMNDNALRNVTGTINNSTVTVDGAKYGLKNDAGKALAVSGSTIEVVNTSNDTGDAGISLADRRLLQDTNTEIVSEIYVAPYVDDATGETNIAQNVAIQFDATGDQHVYDIYAVALDGTINRLSTVQLKFDVVASDADIAYSLTPDKNVALTADLYEEDAYIFNLDGVHEAGRTGAKIKLGQVAFDGVGSFEFKVVPYSTTNDKGTDVQLTAATINDNIVIKYNVNGTVSENTGIFNIDASTTGVIEIVESTRTLTVNVDFNNNITAGNSADYNDFTVTVACANGEVQTGKIGSGSEANVVYDADYTVDSAALDFTVKAGYRYTITIEGAGYRTFRHTTLIGEGEDAFVVNFWNNALADANGNPTYADVEAGKPQKDITFLAGDIVKDNSINIYDLSAVVSYFGEGNFDLNEASKYARYDLNRDGYIDSTDVAYVLVSWDK